MSVRYSVIFPAYDEERTIERAIRETVVVFSALRQPYEIMVVDDGSRDMTAAVVSRLAESLPQLRLVRHERNQGKGRAVQSGVRVSRGDVILFLDCDLSTHPNHITSFLPHLATADILLGSRRVPGASVPVAQPAYRTRLGQLFNLIIRRYLGIPFRDTQCGFKIFTRRAVDIVFHDLQTRGWAFDVEIVLRAMRADLRMKELPVEWRNVKQSRVRLQDAASIVRDLRKLRRTIPS